MKFSLKRVIIAFLILIAAAGGVTLMLRAKAPVVTYRTPEEAQNVYVRFVMEAFDKIRQNYWSSTTEAELADHFQLSLQKAEGSPVVPLLSSRDRSGTVSMMARELGNATSTLAEKNLALNTLIVALYNLPPVGHGELLSSKQETAFRDGISNVDPNKDLYQDLGLQKGASADSVKKAAAEKIKMLANATSSEAKAELKQAAYAEKVLTNPNTKDLYDVAKIEPTVWARIIGKTLYVNLTKVSPSSFVEFGRAIESASTTPLDSMIIDLRGNLGGALDFAPNFLGLFLGNNQYAFDFFHQGEYLPQRTVEPYFPELARYKEIAVLTDRMTQSTAEVTTAAFKRFKLGVIIGETTRGWGTIENTFPLDTSIDPAEKYTMLLVHSLTLRDDNQPVEGRGVDPDINIKDPSWRAELSDHFRLPSIIAAIKQVAASVPLQ